MRNQVRNTGRLLEKCQKTLEILTNNNLTEKNEKLNIQKEILNEYKHIRRVYEDIANTIKEHYAVKDNLSRERNKLLRENLRVSVKNFEDYV